MTTKQLLTLSIVVVFLTGVAMGYSLNDALHPEKKLVPQNSREQQFAAEIVRQRLNTASKADTLRVDANAAVRDFVYGVSQSARTLTQGGSINAVQSSVDTRVASVAIAYNAVLNNQEQSQYRGAWQELANSILQYAQVKATNRPAEQALARQAISSAADVLGQWYIDHWASVNAAQLRTQLNSGVADLIASVDVATSGTTISFLNSEQRAVTTLAKMIDAVSVAVINQAPSRF